jgi:hypothetical protein
MLQAKACFYLAITVVLAIIILIATYYCMIIEAKKREEIKNQGVKK